MIHEYTPPELTEGYNSSWLKGEADVTIFLGHGEYSVDTDYLNSQFAESYGTLREDVYDAYDAEEKGLPIPAWLERCRGNHSYDEILADDVEARWGTAVRLQGSVFQIWRYFYTLASQLDPEYDPADYTPGGDDDTFDYYPSAFDAMEELAGDLDTMNTRLPDDVRHGFTARQRIVDILRKLRTSKGEFADWEFDDHAKPYIEEV